MKLEEIKEFLKRPVKIEKKGNKYIYYGEILCLLTESIKFRNRDDRLMLIDCSDISSIEEVDSIKKRSEINNEI